MTRRSLERVLGVVGFAAGWTYVATVLLFGERVLGVQVGVAALGVLLLHGYGLILWAVRRGMLRTLEAGLAVLATVVALLTADVAVGVFLNARAAGGDLLAHTRDPQVWHGELMPRSFRPAGQDYTVYKPNVTVSGFVYGEFYDPAMLGSPTLVDSVLERRRVTYVINELGFRERTPLAEARIFALGDSYVFGYATDEDSVWTEVLERELGRPLYNLGVSATGPGTQLALLRHLLATRPVRIEHLLWMIFEGNDLENDFPGGTGDNVRRAGGPGPAALVRGTMAEELLSFPQFVKRGSMIDRLRSGQLRLGQTGTRPESVSAHRIEGVTTGPPLYHSALWGYSFFNPDDVERATKPASYIVDHPHAARLRETFRGMQDLADSMGFRVTVVIAPSAPRLYGADFEAMPRPSAEPHFVNHVAALARARRFEVVNLLEHLAPYARREYLYYRDDHHWNGRGNVLVAEILSRAARF